MINKIKIVAGGQTGVDQAALQAALDQGLEIGGWCPPGRLCENGKIPERFTLKETKHDRSTKAPHIPRSLRSEWNVRDSDATLVLSPLKEDPGTQWTAECCRIYAKSCIMVDPGSKDQLMTRNWLKTIDVGILNVAGPSESSFPGVYQSAYSFLIQILS